MLYYFIRLILDTDTFEALSSLRDSQRFEDLTDEEKDRIRTEEKAAEGKAGRKRKYRALTKEDQTLIRNTVARSVLHVAQTIWDSFHVSLFKNKSELLAEVLNQSTEALAETINDEGKARVQKFGEKAGWSKGFQQSLVDLATAIEATDAGMRRTEGGFLRRLFVQIAGTQEYKYTGNKDQKEVYVKRLKDLAKVVSNRSAEKRFFSKNKAASGEVKESKKGKKKKEDANADDPLPITTIHDFVHEVVSSEAVSSVYKVRRPSPNIIEDDNQPAVVFNFKFHLDICDTVMSNEYNAVSMIEEVFEFMLYLKHLRELSWNGSIKNRKEKIQNALKRHSNIFSCSFPSTGIPVEILQIYNTRLCDMEDSVHLLLTLYYDRLYSMAVKQGINMSMNDFEALYFSTDEGQYDISDIEKLKTNPDSWLLMINCMIRRYVGDDAAEDQKFYLFSSSRVRKIYLSAFSVEKINASTSMPSNDKNKMLQLMDWIATLEEDSNKNRPLDDDYWKIPDDCRWFTDHGVAALARIVQTIELSATCNGQRLDDQLSHLVVCTHMRSDENPGDEETPIVELTPFSDMFPLRSALFGQTKPFRKQMLGTKPDSFLVRHKHNENVWYPLETFWQSTANQNLHGIYNETFHHGFLQAFNNKCSNLFDVLSRVDMSTFENDDYDTAQLRRLVYHEFGKHVPEAEAAADIHHSSSSSAAAAAATPGSSPLAASSQQPSNKSHRGSGSSRHKTPTTRKNNLNLSTSRSDEEDTEESDNDSDDRNTPKPPQQQISIAAEVMTKFEQATKLGRKLAGKKRRCVCMY